MIEFFILYYIVSALENRSQISLGVPCVGHITVQQHV